MGELRTAAWDFGVPPVAVASGQRVIEDVCPVLELEVGAIGGGAARVVDPGAGRPAGAGPHQRGMQGALGIDGKARHPAVEQRDSAGFEAVDTRRWLLRDEDL